MAELVLRLRVDPATGRREVVVDYASDADALPVEHEEEHRRLAASVIDGGLTHPRVAVTRAAEATPDGTPTTSGEAASDPTATPTPLPARG